MTCLQMLAQARVLREVARQGLLPFPEFFASIKPFGTPLAPVSLKLLITILIIIAPPAEDAVNLLLDLSFYPGLVRQLHSVCLCRLIMMKYP